MRTRVLSTLRKQANKQIGVLACGGTPIISMLGRSRQEYSCWSTSLVNQVQWERLRLKKPSKMENRHGRSWKILTSGLWTHVYLQTTFPYVQWSSHFTVFKLYRYLLIECSGIQTKAPHEFLLTDVQKKIINCLFFFSSLRWLPLCSVNGIPWLQYFSGESCASEFPTVLTWK